MSRFASWGKHCKSFFWYTVLSKYVLNQNRTIPMVVVGVASNVINILLHYLLLHEYSLGVTGSAVSQSVAYFSCLAFTLLYIVCSGMYKPTWDGWTLDCLRDWAPFVKLSLAGMIMVCVEWWAFEIGVFLCGILGKTELGAQSVLMQLDVIYFQIPLGMQVTCCIRTGQSLGAGDIVGARRTSRVGLAIIGVVSIASATLFTLFRQKLPLIFTNIQDVAKLTSALLPLVAAYMFFDSIAAVCKGVLHGSGRQYLGAVILVVSYYCVVFPIAGPLMFMTNLRSFGYWWPMAGALVMQSFIVFLIVIFTNWQLQADKARERTGIIAEREKQVWGEEEETRGLLRDEEENSRRSSLSSSLSMAEIRALTHQPEDTPIRTLLQRRALVAAVFLVLVLAALLVRLSVQIPKVKNSPDQDLLCIPYEQNMGYNGSLPICNTTSSALPSTYQPSMQNTTFSTPPSLLATTMQTTDSSTLPTMLQTTVVP